MNTRIWLHSIAAAAVGGISTAVTASIVVPSAVNWSSPGMMAMAKIAVAGALLNVLAFLKQSPLPCPVPLVNNNEQGNSHQQ